MSRDVPEGWRSVRLAEVAYETRARNIDLRIPQDRLVGVFKDEGMTPARDRVRGASVERCKIVRPGAFAYNPMRLNIGSIARWYGLAEAIVSPDYVVFEADPTRLDGGFLDHLRASQSWRKFTEGAGDGGVRIRIYFDHLAEFRFPLPPLFEQRRIAEILSSVDEAIQVTQAVIEQTRKVKEGVLQRLLTKGTGHLRFKQTEIGEIPEEWEVVALADLAESSRNSFVIGPFGSDLVMSDYRDEGVPVVFVRDVRPGQLKWKSNVFVSEEKAIQLQAHSVKPGDVIVTKMGLPPGIAALCPEDFSRGVVTADIIRLRPNKTKVDPAFLVELLNGDRVREAVQEITGGQTRPKITLRDYKSIKIALPQPSEQRLIREGVAPFKASIEGQEEQLTILKVLKNALMSDLLTGRKRVSSAHLMAAE